MVRPGENEDRPTNAHPTPRPRPARGSRKTRVAAVAAVLLATGAAAAAFAVPKGRMPFGGPGPTPAPAGAATMSAPAAGADGSADASATLAALGTPAGTDVTDASPSHYYVWCNVTPPYTGPRDENGIIMIRPVRYAPLVHNPTTVAQWAIHFYENWLHTKKQAELDDFLVQARWLRDNMDEQGRLAHPYPHTRRGIESGWYSAMGQGIATSVLVRAYQTTGDETFMTAARKAMKPFSVDVADGGVVTEGGKWLEEYPDSHHVLNGSIFAAFGVYDMVRATNDLEARRIWWAFTGNLAEHIGDYESHGAILYELYPERYCHTRYFDLHLRQLRSLAQLTGEVRFADAAERWGTSFRAYPEPEIRVSQRPGDGGRSRIEGTVEFLYDYYYPKDVRVVVSAVSPEAPDGAPVAQVPVTYDASGTAGSFSWIAPAVPSDTTYRFTIPDQPKTSKPAYDYRQKPLATLLVRGTIAN